MKAEKCFFEEVKTKKSPGPDPIDEKSPTRTFNHINDYAIEDEVIWVRRRGIKSEWRPIYFDGGPRRVLPTLISCDGANLFVLDNLNQGHYKKVLKEYRPEEIDEKNNLHIKNDDIIDKNNYLVVDKSTLNNWKEHWFSLPLVYRIVNFFTGKRLKLSGNYRSISISHRGRYNNYTEDAAGQKHHVSAGVTTLYCLADNRREITKYDPWSPIWAKTKINFPETSDTVFEAIRLDASASTIMAIGYEINIHTGDKTLKVLTKLADIDTEGGNPGLKYDYFRNEKDKDVRVLPVEKGWREHALPDKAKLNGNISIIQTGEGNAQRKLRIVGTNGENKSGYFSKMLYEDKWVFQEKDILINDVLPLEEKINQMELQTSVADYQGVIDKINKKITIKNFGDGSNYSEIKIKDKDNEIKMFLYKRATLWNFLGIDKKRYDLVIPDGNHNNPAIKKIFGNKRVYRVKANVKNNELTIAGTEPFSFKYTLEKQRKGGTH